MALWKIEIIFFAQQKIFFFSFVTKLFFCRLSHIFRKARLHKLSSDGLVCFVIVWKTISNYIEIWDLQSYFEVYFWVAVAHSCSQSSGDWGLRISVLKLSWVTNQSFRHLSFVKSFVRFSVLLLLVATSD